MVEEGTGFGCGGSRSKSVLSCIHVLLVETTQRHAVIGKVRDSVDGCLRPFTFATGLYQIHQTNITLDMT